MLSHRIYYSLKPYLPWRLRMGLRRVRARRIRLAHQQTWPIDPTAAAKPEGWPGWPDGKRFALVLTHDVEGPSGLAKCEALARLEQERGYYSTFNLIPEGPYKVPPEFVQSLQHRGFEIGVHDLKHDGWLYRSRTHFEDHAQRINRYVKDWRAHGFRSGFMLRNLRWLQRLDVRYDASTFDTDPFEPQSDGVGTIFPFWVPSERPAPDSTPSAAEGRGGYVELPYTLPQDSTLFLVLQENSPEIWLRKLEWIARHGGLALVNVHPDYIQLEGEPASPRTYPVGHYLKLLEYARREFGGQFWQPLAGDLAEYVSRCKPRLRPRKRRVAMLTHSFYENDNRVTRYAETLAERGDHVDVFALRRSASLAKQERLEGVHLHRIVPRSGKQERSKLGYLWSWLRFLATATVHVERGSRQNRYDLVHVHNMPDFLIFSALPAKLRGARVILDIHDLTSDFYASKFGSNKGGLAPAVLRWTERISARLADHVIISNHLWLEKYTQRTGTADRASVFINNVDTRVFRPHDRSRRDERKVIVFPGGLQWHQGLDLAIRAMPAVRHAVPQAEFHIYGDGNQKAALQNLTAELGLEHCVRFFDPVPVREVAQLMADADVGVVPKRADSFGNEAYSTKIMEFMSVGVPVVISETKIDRFYFNDTVARFFPSGDTCALTQAIIELLTSPTLARRLKENAYAYVSNHSWTQRKESYLRIVDSLITTGSAGCETEFESDESPIMAPSSNLISAIQ